jgi:predicted HicB family RNase H-like nuclease
MMEYKGYIGQVELDEGGRTFHGEVINIRDVVTFQGASVKELQQAFKDSVDDYLAFCKERGELPDKPYSGQFVTRVDADLHRKISLAAAKAGISLNSWVKEQLQNAVASVPTDNRQSSQIATGARPRQGRHRVKGNDQPRSLPLQRTTRPTKKQKTG